MAFTGQGGNTIEAYTSALPPVVSLTNASAVSNGIALDGTVVRTYAVLSVSTSANVTAGAVQLQASLDGVNYWNVGSPVSTTAGSTTTAVPTLTGLLARYFRAAITTAISGGTVTASVGVK